MSSSIIITTWLCKKAAPRQQSEPSEFEALMETSDRGKFRRNAKNYAFSFGILSGRVLDHEGFDWVLDSSAWHGHCPRQSAEEVTVRDQFTTMFFLTSLFIPIAMCLVGMLALVTSLIVNHRATVHRPESGRAPAAAQSRA